MMAHWRMKRVALVLFLVVVSTRNTNAGIEKLEEVENKYADISTAKERKEDALALMTPYGDWHHMLTSAPMAISLLGNLMLIATKTDFSLEDKRPKDGFKYLKYPSSFRASLLQISNIGFRAFDKAHTNMDQIRLYTTNVDTHMKSIVRLLMYGTDIEVDKVVPMVLKRLQHVADTCVSLSEEMETQFDSFLDVIIELSEASAVAKSVHDEKQTEVKRAIKVYQTEKERADKEKQEYDEENQKIAGEINQALSDYKEALKSSPSGWKLFGMGLLDTVSNVFRAVTVPFGGFSGSSSSGGGYDPPPTYEESQQDRSKRHVYTFAEDINYNIQILVSVSTSGNDKGEKVPNLNDIESIYEVKARLELIRQNIERIEIQTGVYQKAMTMCLQGIRLSETLIKMKEKIQETESNSVKTLIINAEDLLEDAKKFLIEAATFSQNTFMNQNGPRKTKRHMSSSSLVKAELEMYQTKVEAATEVLKDARKRQESVQKDIKDANARITRTMVKLTELDIKNIDFKKIRETLIEGIKVIAELRNRWTEITRFFRIISNIVKVGLHIEIKQFIEAVEVDSELKMSKIDVSDQIRNLIYQNVFKASIYAYYVRSMSSAFVEVSGKHLISDITSLGSLIALDPEMDKNEIQKQQKSLSDKCAATQKTIETLAIDRRKQFEKYLETRISTIENEVKVLFPKSKSKPSVSSPEDRFVG